jgi:DNA-binding transcriptional ArsR family regulator
MVNKNSSLSGDDLSGDELLAVLEALSNPHRLKIISILSKERQYVSQLARAVQMSRPLLYMHLQKLEAAGLVTSELELSEDGKSMKYYELKPFDIRLTKELIAKSVNTLTIKKKGE